MNKVAPKSADAATLVRVVEQAREMYPDAEVKVRRGRVIAVDDDLIRLISYRTSSRSAA
jgi:hypothetical protein